MFFPRQAIRHMPAYALNYNPGRPQLYMDVQSPATMCKEQWNYYNNVAHTTGLVDTCINMPHTMCIN